MQATAPCLARMAMSLSLSLALTQQSLQGTSTVVEAPSAGSGSLLSAAGESEAPREQAAASLQVNQVFPTLAGKRTENQSQGSAERGRLSCERKLRSISYIWGCRLREWPKACHREP